MVDVTHNSTHSTDTDRGIANPDQRGDPSASDITTKTRAIDTAARTAHAGSGPKVNRSTDPDPTHDSTPIPTPSQTPGQSPGPAPEPPLDRPFESEPNPASESPAPRLIAMMNQKGGVGKTTTTVNLGAALANLGKRVLLIDLDPQSHLTLHLGLDPDHLESSVYDLLTDPDRSAGEVAYQVRDNLVILPAEMNLAGVESELVTDSSHPQPQKVLADKCAPLISNQWFDFVLIDCPPSLGLLTINALAMVGEVLVPMQPHFLALQGLSKLLETVTLVKQSLNPPLIVSGMILCMHESKTLLANEVANDLRAFLADARSRQDLPWSQAVVHDPPIRRNIKLAESPSFGQTIFDYAPNCPGAQDYTALAKSLINQTLHPRPRIRGNPEDQENPGNPRPPQGPQVVIQSLSTPPPKPYPVPG